MTAPVTSRDSPTVYVVFVGCVFIVIDVTEGATIVVLNVVVFPPYVTVTTEVPAVELSKPEHIGVVILTVLVLVSLYVTVI